MTTRTRSNSSSSSSATAIATPAVDIPSVLDGVLDTQKVLQRTLKEARKAYTVANAEAKTARDKAIGAAYAQFTYDKDHKALNAAVREARQLYTSTQRSLADARDEVIANAYAAV